MNNNNDKTIIFIFNVKLIIKYKNNIMKIQ